MYGKLLLKQRRGGYRKRDKEKNNFRRKNHSQMIILMGVILALAVFFLGGLAAELTDLDIATQSERATSMLPEFINVKESFGVSLNYNIIQSIQKIDDTVYYYGDFADNIESGFNKTRDDFYLMELNNDVVFNADLISYRYSYKQDGYYVYEVLVRLSLDDADTFISEDVTYLITCNPVIDSN